VGEAIAVAVLLLLGAGVVALRAVLDGARVGVPASISVLAPVAETARLVRSRPLGARSPVLPIVGGAGLLVASLLRALAVPIAQPTVLGVAGFAIADAVWWIAGALLLRGGLRYLGRAVAVEAPILLALAVPVLAGVGDLPLAAEAPVALLLLLIAGVLLPWAVPAPGGQGLARLLVGAARATQPVAAAAAAAVLLLPTGTAWLVGATVVLAALVVLAARRFPTLRPPRVARVSALILLPLAAVQLAVVVALAVLAG
jgi:NADH-quinone oxidoreductase subunit H